MDGILKARGGLSVLARDERSAESDKWTPPWLVERIRTDVFWGVIELDPCTVSRNPVGAARFYTADNDGILQPWDATTIYCNPPYGKTIRHWTQKCIMAGARGKYVALLVPARTGSRWFTEAWCNATDTLFFHGRIRFVGEPTGAHFPSVLFGYNVTFEKLNDLGVRCRVID